MHKAATSTCVLFPIFVGQSMVHTRSPNDRTSNLNFTNPSVGEVFNDTSQGCGTFHLDNVQRITVVARKNNPPSKDVTTGSGMAR